MNSISLNVYEITITKANEKEELVLSDYDNGKSLLQQLDTMFNSWKTDLTRDIGSKKVSRLKKRDNEDKWYYHLTANYIDGIIDSGDYGTQEDIIDIETGKSKYTKTPQDATLIPFYFMIYIEPNSTIGYILIERISNVGIASVLSKAIREYIHPLLSERHTLHIQPSLVPKILKINLAAYSGTKKIILRGVGRDQFKNPQTMPTLSECKTDVSFIAPKNEFIHKAKEIFDNLRGKKKEEPYKVDNIECQDVAFEIDINGKRRTISVAKLINIGMNVDITHHVELDSTGYPTYSSLSNNAHEILTYIKESNESL